MTKPICAPIEEDHNVITKALTHLKRLDEILASIWGYHDNREELSPEKADEFYKEFFEIAKELGGVNPKPRIPVESFSKKHVNLAVTRHMAENIGEYRFLCWKIVGEMYVDLSKKIKKSFEPTYD